MTRDEAIDYLEGVGRLSDDDFPLLEAAIACALHDLPSREAHSVRILANHAVERLKERAANESPDDALTETMGSDLRLTGDLLNYDDPDNTDLIMVAERRRGLSAALVIFYLDAAKRAGLEAAPVDFPNHVLLRVETPEGPVALDPFSHGRLVLPSELTRRALLAGLTPHIADRLDLLMAPITPRQALIRLQGVQYARAVRDGDYEQAERAALRSVLLDPQDLRPWLDVAHARERLGALNGTIEALRRARGGTIGEGAHHASLDRVRMRLN